MLPVAVTGIRAEWQNNRPAQSKTGANHSATRASAMKTAAHADIAAKAHQREKLERLCRYIARIAVVSERLSLSR